MSDLASRKCSPTGPSAAALPRGERTRLLGQLPGWQIEGERLRKTFVLPDFARALALVNRIGAIAEAEQHHPDLQLAWGKVVMETYTHSIGALSMNDFILAAKVEEALARP